VSREDVIEIEAVVREALSATLYKVEIENGHRLLGFVTGKSRAGLEMLSAGDRVMMRLSPFDLSKGRIIGKVVK
jgi:translation initiation factor IF-1